MSEIDGKVAPPPAGYTSVRLGAAFLMPADEADHYELFRQTVTVANEGDRTVKSEAIGTPIGPLARYRRKGRGDKTPKHLASVSGPPLEMKTTDAKGQPMTLILLWWPGMDNNK
jgi:hypothetical protein